MLGRPNTFSLKTGERLVGDWLNRRRILVVDDDPEFVATLSVHLERAGYSVMAACDGEEAMILARHWRPDAIVLDEMMPRKDGHATCRELKRDPLTSDIPILLLTAVGDHVTRTRHCHRDGMTSEADDHLGKGATPDEVLASLRDLLE